MSVYLLSGIFIDYALNLWIKLGKTDILTILNLPICEHGVSVYSVLLFLSSKSCCFSPYRFYTYVVRFIPKYFILGGANINDTVFLISHSTRSLKEYKKQLTIVN